MNKSVYIASRTYWFYCQYAKVLVWKTSIALNQSNYRGTGTLTIVRILISLNFFVYCSWKVLIVSDIQIFLLNPVIINFKYEATNLEIVSFNQWIIFWFFDLLWIQILTELKKQLYKKYIRNRQRRLRLHILVFLIFIVLFSK